MTWRHLVLAWLAVQTAALAALGIAFALLHPMCRFDLLDAYRGMFPWEHALRTCRLVNSDNIWWADLVKEYLL